MSSTIIINESIQLGSIIDSLRSHVIALQAIMNHNLNVEFSMRQACTIMPESADRPGRERGPIPEIHEQEQSTTRGPPSPWLVCHLSGYYTGGCKKTREECENEQISWSGGNECYTRFAYTDFDPIFRKDEITADRGEMLESLRDSAEVDEICDRLS